MTADIKNNLEPLYNYFSKGSYDLDLVFF